MKTQEAIELAGSPSKLAEALDITRQAVHYWGLYPPIDKQYLIQDWSRGKLKVEKSIRPKKTKA